jgi:hypothetical protein
VGEFPHTKPAAGRATKALKPLEYNIQQRSTTIGMTGARTAARLQMNVTFTKCRLMVAALFALTAGMGAAQTNAGGASKQAAPHVAAPPKSPPPKESPPPKPSAAPKQAPAAAGSTDSAAENARAAAAKAKEQAVNFQRERMISEYEALAKQYREATEEQKKVILEKMQERKKAFDEALSNLHREIRDEQRRQRQSGSPKR